jgi:hypothetical protein
MQVGGIAVSPAAGTLFATQAGAAANTLYRSSDGGGSWSALGSFGDPCGAVAVDPKSPATLWVACPGLGSAVTRIALYKSTNASGAAGSVALSPAMAGVQAFSVRALSLKPGAPDSLAMVTPALVQSLDGAQTWTDLESSLGYGGAAYANFPWREVGYDASGALYAHGSAGIFKVGPTKLVKLPDPPGQAPSAYTLWVHPGKAGMLFATAGAAAFRCTDPCASWTALGAFPAGRTDLSFGQAARAAGIAILAFSRAGTGLSVSIDDGATWSEIASFASREVDDLIVDPLASGSAWASVAGEGILRSSDAGLTWSTFAAGRTGLLAVDGRGPQPIVYQQSDADQRVRVSTDLGASWTDANSGLDRRAARALRFAPNPDPSARVLYLGADERGLFKTSSGGL